MAVAPADAAPLLEAVVAAVEATGAEGPEFEAAYAARSYLAAGELRLPPNSTSPLSEYTFGGLPPELAPARRSCPRRTSGEQVHEIVVVPHQR